MPSVRPLTFLSLVIISGFWILVSGCGAKSGETDANGYLCSRCDAKFVTSVAVIAEFCPACQSPEIKPIIGFVCEKDKATVLAPSDSSSVKCSQCGATLAGIRLPQEKDFRAWGATPKKKSEVTR